MPDVLPEDIIKGVADILWGDFGLSRKNILKAQVDALKATKFTGGKFKPDHVVRMQASDNLMAYSGNPKPTAASRIEGNLTGDLKISVKYKGQENWD